MSDSPQGPPRSLLAALHAYSDATGPELRASPVSTGLLHQTWAVETGSRRWIAQQVNPIFSAAIHENIVRVTNHLRSRGLETLEICTTRDGRLFVDGADGSRWRLLRRMSGVTFDRCVGSAQARAAGASVASFHSALADFDAPLAPLGFPYHETSLHLQALHQALSRHPDHPLHADVNALTRQIEAAFEAHRPPEALPSRVIHGDLKLSNVLFAGPDPPACNEVVALIDLDTVARRPLYFDLGDAWRSWCNRRTEDAQEAQLDVSIYAAAAEGYRSALGFTLSADEWRSLEVAFEWVTLELCARYATDTLEENYFAWDAEQYASAAEHNWARANGQWNLYQQALDTATLRLESLRD